MGRYASNRNFGYGKQIAFAGKQALRDYYGQGHHETVATHSQRWTQFSIWVKEEKGINNLSKTDNRELAQAYAEHVRERVEAGELSISTAQNHISTVNTTFSALRSDKYVNMSPSEHVGNRSNIRQAAPAGLNQDRVTASAAALREAGLHRAAAVLMLANAFGVRREEAIKANLDRWSREARNGAVNVIDGTKGGRDAERRIQVGEVQKQALKHAMSIRPAGSRNLIASRESYSQLAIQRSGEINQSRAVLKQHGLPGYHDLRAAFACQRYEQITGSPAPVVDGGRQISKAQDRKARSIISGELGHGRLDVLNSYIGSSR
ncbi:integrase domain-containing protein [Halomonas piscis]|uniref:integrase domain-containing protein n=1 Tax=Halomonas piscis TaxID=3031727 RepID=UPI00289AF7CA|nr:integrase domain-containing protein [Halomonas piscis]